MLFLESDFSIKILSVRRHEWQFDGTDVKPRPFNAISFRVKGNSTFSDKEKESHLSDGDILFMPQNVGYHVETAKEDVIIVHFELDDHCPKQDFFEVIRPKHPQSYEDIFVNLYHIWNNHDRDYYFRSMALMYTLFAKLTNHLPQAENPSYLRIKKSIEYINRHFKDPDININTLCELSNISNTYFRKLFYELYQTTPLYYINQLRINYAAELLETGYYTIEYVAEKCGFDDPKYFSTVFKKYKQCSPSAYRNYRDYIVP